MPRFAYTARDRAGKSVSAELEAPSRKDALRLLGARGLQVASVNEVASATPAKSGRSAAKQASATTAPPSARPARRGNAGPLTRRECLPFLEALYDLAIS